MEEDRILKLVEEWKSHGKKWRGRSRKNWINWVHDAMNKYCLQPEGNEDTLKVVDCNWETTGCWRNSSYVFSICCIVFSQGKFQILDRITSDGQRGRIRYSVDLWIRLSEIISPEPRTALVEYTEDDLWRGHTFQMVLQHLDDDAVTCEELSPLSRHCPVLFSTKWDW